MKMGTLDTVAMLLVVVGAINWGLVGLLDLNLVSSILGATLSKFVYILVGVGGLLVLYKWYAGMSKKK
jgi:uncharacterized protein